VDRPSRKSHAFRLLQAVTVLSLAVGDARAQDSPTHGRTEPALVERDSVVTLTPGAQYRRSRLVELILGRHYRTLWATPIRVSMLNMRRYGGGLTPIRAHAGSQTQSLRFTGGDGRTYQFRAIEKNPLTQLAPELRESIAAWALKDGASSSHPVGSLVASALLAAVGVLHVDQTLVVLPDDPALEEYRAEFAGRFGMIEERPDETDQVSSAFAGARQVISPTRLFERIDRSPDDRVDARAFLVARLMDILMGDRDRHRDQFRWARLDGDSLWQPISRDHDEAFVKLDGPILEAAARYDPALVNFTDDYPPHYRLNWHAREIDRRFLVELDRRDWDSVATALQARLTDAVIDSAVGHLPPEMYAVGGASLARTLKVRRDKLVNEALSYYAFLAGEVEIHATDAAEIAEVLRADDHNVDVAIRRRATDARPYFQRRFNDRETHEIRLRLWGGDDRVIVRGNGDPNIKLRIIGGAGDDEMVDSSRAGGVAFYDDSGTDTLMSVMGSRLNTRHYAEWIGSDSSRYPPQEWGTLWQPIPWLSAGSDLGLLVGAGFIRTTYGFRKSPFASNVTAKVGYATGAAAVGAELLADVRRENRSQYWHLRLLASGIETQRFYGYGNQSTAVGSSQFYRVTLQQYAIEPSAVWPLTSQFAISAGPLARWSRTSANAGRFIATLRDTLYGAHDFGQLGGRVGITLDSRDKESNAHRGVLLSGEGRFYPAIWDANSAFGSAEGRAETYISAPILFAPTLALRAAGKKVWGTFPFNESAFLGGPSSLRGYYQQRFAGDASVSSSAELRLTLVRSQGFFPALWGIFGNADAGRVYVTGRSPGGWHTGTGGGVWVGLLDRTSTVSIGITRGSEQTLVYTKLGFPF
jgi:hypothetical protein